jgi:hypothetical protein
LYVELPKADASDLISLIKAILNLDRAPTSLPIRKHQDPQYDENDLRNFIKKWHTNGAHLPDVGPELVKGLVDFSIDPSSGPFPWEAMDLGEYPNAIRAFIMEYYVFAQFMSDRHVPARDKMDIGMLLFDDPQMDMKHKRKMRRGLRSRRHLAT